MPKTVIEKSQSPNPDVTVFSVSGTLGFHEKDTLEKLFDECKKRCLSRVIMDMTALTSLGGGCAKIIRAAASAGDLTLGIAGAKATVIKFLKDEGQLVIAGSVEEAVSVLTGEATTAPEAAAAPPTPDPPVMDPAGKTVEISPANVQAELGGAKPQPAAPRPQPRDDGVIELDLNVSPPQAPDPPPAAKPAERPAAPVQPPDPVSADPRELQKRIYQYNTLFSLTSEFVLIQDRKNLLELFLLTTIAQVGVESAMFLEFREGYFTPAAVKGIEADELRGFALSAQLLDIESWKQTLAVHTVESAPFSDEVKAPLLSLGCAYVAPFVVHDEFRGIVALGKPLKRDLDEGTTNFLKILVNQAAIAYESTQRFEEEKQRTLGLVQTLIALIEENTLARGNTNLLSSYTYELARKIHYPEEHIRDLMYGTVLRDIGMIKVSDLIVRSPRELMPEEWEIIKRHPIDGGEMLRKMKFSEHAVSIVIAHHERFNGEGYPNGVQGKQIPVGARIVSIVESYAAMLQERPTRPALTKEEALNTLKENWGMRYDPDVVKSFVEIVEVELRTGEKVHEEKFELFSV
jgi:hypothetical protein